MGEEGSSCSRPGRDWGSVDTAKGLYLENLAMVESAAQPPTNQTSDWNSSARVLEYASRVQCVAVSILLSSVAVYPRDLPNQPQYVGERV